MVEKILVREYLSSLKEDGELDYIFIFLLESMGFKIITTPKHSKGQSQYGKDVVAIGEVKGVKYSWNFELKGFADKDVDSITFNKDDGIRMSLLEIKDVAYENKSIPEFDKLPIKVVLVHNGIVKENIKPQFNGFIKNIFPAGEFEDWDIYRLTDLFYEHLFCEYLLSDDNNSFSFKRLLMFLDVPDYNFEDLQILISNIIQEYDKKPNDRQHRKLFSTLNLLMMILWNYSSQKNNLNPAKYCVDYLILNLWSFLLTKNVEKSKKLKKSFCGLLETQMRFYKAYLDKTFEVASFNNGLFIPQGVGFERIGYPLRSFEYIDYLIYFYKLNNAFVYDKNTVVDLEKNQKESLKVLISNNKEALCKPILDNHFIPIFHLVDFFLNSRERTQDDLNFIGKYVFDCLEGIYLRKNIKGVFPYHGHNLEYLIRLEATGQKDENYPDSSSLLIPFLLELLAIFSMGKVYDDYIEFFKKNISLQTAIPSVNEYPDFENRFFKGHLHNEYNIEIIVDLPKTMSEFKEKLLTKNVTATIFKTETMGYSFLLTLARSFYKNEPFPEGWRCWLK